MPTLLETTLGWLADLVPVLHYKDDVPQTQRRRWSFDGNPFAVTDDGPNEVSRFTLNPIKAQCRAATVANHSLSGLTAFDSVTPVAGDRILVRAQTASAENGIYVAASGAWSRAKDMNTGGKVAAAHIVAVQEGSLFGNTLWMLVANEPISLGTTLLPYARVPLSFTPNAPYELIRLVTTTNATQTTIASLTLNDNTVYRVNAWVVARGTAGVERALYGVTALVYRQAASVATIQGSVQTLHAAVETTAGLDATITVSSNDVRVSVTGLAATTINWKVKVEFHEVV